MSEKYLNVGCIVEKGREQTFEIIQLSNESLKELVELITAHAKEHLGGLSVDGIRAGERLKWGDPNRIPRIEISMFDPSEKAPDFIKMNLAVKKV